MKRVSETDSGADDRRANFIFAIILPLALLIPSTVMAQSSFSGSLKNISITDAAGTNAPPNAAFTYTISGTTVTFDASASTDNDGSISDYRWKFGDGSSATGISATHSYSSLGNYTVQLTVTDNQNGISILQKAIGTSTCQATPTINAESNKIQRQAINNEPNLSAFVGGIYLNTDITVCKAQLYMRTGLGDLSNKTFYLYVYSLSSTKSFNTLKAKSNAVSGSLIPAKVSPGYVEFTFSTPVIVKTGDALVVTMDGSADTSNVADTYYGTAIPNTISFGRWTYGGTISWESKSYSFDIKLYEVQK